MRRSASSSLSLAAVLAVVLALAFAPAASAAGAAGSDAAQTSANRGKRKASTCTKRRAAKGRRGRARRSVAAEASARGSSRKGRKRTKSCSTKRATPKRDDSARGDRPSRDPRERRRQREEEKGRRRPTPAKPTTPAKLAPADGTYTVASVPGLTVTISGDGTRGRIVATVPKSDFDEAVCQTEDIPVDVPLELSRSNDASRSGVIGNQQLPGDGTVSVLGFVAADGSFGVSLNTTRPYLPNPGSTCAAFTRLTGTLTR